MLLRKLRYRVILQYLKYTTFRKLIVQKVIFKILLLFVAVHTFLRAFWIAHRIPDTRKPLVGGEVKTTKAPLRCLLHRGSRLVIALSLLLASCPEVSQVPSGYCNSINQHSMPVFFTRPLLGIPQRSSAGLSCVAK